MNYAGHQVTVFERDDVPGGLLRYGIPDFKLEKWVVERRVKLMEEEGVVFKCNANVGVNIRVNDLLREFHAIVLAGGSTIPRELPIPGRELKGVYFAMEFLKQQNKYASANFKENGHHRILATDKNVVVIGGGDTGSDCVGTSNRHQAISVTQFELLPKPQIPNTIYAMAHVPNGIKNLLVAGRRSGKKMGGCNKRVHKRRKGNLKGLKVVDLEWKLMDDGRPAQFVEVPGSESEIPCELALLAMGFVHPQHEGMIQELGVELDERGNVKAVKKNINTSIPKVFSAGDMRRGQSLVVWAISEGRECARKVDEYLMGSSILESKDDNLIAVFKITNYLMKTTTLKVVFLAPFIYIIKY